MKLNILYVVAGVIGIIGSALCLITTLLSLISILSKISSPSLAYLDIELFAYNIIMLILSIVSLRASNSLRIGGYAVRDNSVILIVIGAVMMFLKGGTGSFLVLLGGVLGLMAYLISEII